MMKLELKEFDYRWIGTVVIFSVAAGAVGFLVGLWLGG